MFSTAGSIKTKLLYGLLSVLSAISIFALGARMPLISLIVIILFMPILISITERKLRYFLAYIGSMVLLTLLIYSVFTKVLDPSDNRYAHYLTTLKAYFDNEKEKDFSEVLKVNERYYIWPIAWQLIKEKPWFGYHTKGDVQLRLNEEFKKQNLHKRFLLYDSHNQYLSYWLCYGIFGLILLLGVLSMCYYKAFKAQNYLYLAFLMLVSLCFLTENILNRQLGATFFAFFNSLFYFHWRK